MKTKLSIALSLSFFFSVGQEYAVIDKIDSIPQIKEKGLYYLSQQTDTSNVKYLATVQYSGSDIYKLISKNLPESANDLNANAFKLQSYKDDNGVCMLTLRLYSIFDEEASKIKQLRSKNKIYLFGHHFKDEVVKLNKGKFAIPKSKIIEYRMKENEMVEVSKGGIGGARFRFAANNATSVYLAFEGFSGSASSFMGSSINIKTGGIFELKEDFALLLLQIKNSDIIIINP